MQCPFCRVAVAANERFCPNCDLGLTQAPGGAHARLPEIVPGALLVGRSFATEPLPGRPARHEHTAGISTLEGTPKGVLVSYHAAVTGAFSDLSLSFDDACLRAGFTPLDPGARLGLAARHAVLGAAQVYYAFNVSLAGRSAWIERYVQWSNEVASEIVSPIVPIPSWAMLGVSIMLQFRAQGPTLRAYVGDDNVLAVHDPHFTRGSFGIRVGREPEAAGLVRVLCHGYDLHGVRA